MHQSVSTPAPAPLTAKQRRTRRKKQTIYGLIALVVLWIDGSIIWGKREKPIPVTTETAIRIMSRFKRDRLVSGTANRLVIRDLPGLKTLASAS